MIRVESVKHILLSCESLLGSDDGITLEAMVSGTECDADAVVTLTRRSGRKTSHCLRHASFELPSPWDGTLGIF